MYIAINIMLDSPLNPFVVNVFTEKYCQNGTDNGTYYGYCHIPFV